MAQRKYDNTPRKERAKKKMGELVTSGKVSEKTLRQMNISTEGMEAIEQAKLEKGQIGGVGGYNVKTGQKADSTATKADSTKSSAASRRKSWWRG